MHHAGYRSLGLRYHYHPFSIVESQLAGALQGMRALKIRGFGVSMPFKLSVMPLLDELAPLAQAIGAVNTIVNTDGHLVGHNTDAHGAVTALVEQRELAGARLLLLGAGGAARAVAFGVAQAGAQLTIANRAQERATELARELTAQGLGDVSSVALSEAQLAAYDVIVNATSVGMDAVPGCPLPVSELRRSQLVMDIVYKPLRTELVTACEERGVPVIHGGRMLLHQAARQFELYTGQAPPLEAMDAALRPFIE